MRIKFDKDPLAIEQKNYLNKVANVYVFYELYYWPKILLKSFTFKSCLFGATNLVKNSDKDKYVYSDYGIAFDGGYWWSFGNGTKLQMFTFSMNYMIGQKFCLKVLHLKVICLELLI